MGSAGDLETYAELMPLYFPRDDLEAMAASALLPTEVGNELGEKVVEERKIRIPEAPPRGGSDKKAKDGLYDRGFAEMQDSPDDVRAKEEAAKPKKELEREAEDRKYRSYLRKAQDEDLRDMAALNFIYQSGVDDLGRPVIVFVASQLPADSPKKLEKVLLYMIRTLDPIVNQDYNVIYFHGNVTAQNKPPFGWLKECYGIFNRKYKKNMKRLFIVHPNFWVKLLLYFVQPFVSKKFWRKMQYVQRLFDLYEWFDPKTLLVPEHIRKYDLELYGAEYASSGDFRQKPLTENDKL